MGCRVKSKTMGADVNETPPLLSDIQATFPQMSAQVVWWLGCGRRVIAAAPAAVATSEDKPP